MTPAHENSTGDTVAEHYYVGTCLVQHIQCGNWNFYASHCKIRTKLRIVCISSPKQTYKQTNKKKLIATDVLGLCKMERKLWTITWNCIHAIPSAGCVCAYAKSHQRMFRNENAKKPQLGRATNAHKHARQTDRQTPFAVYNMIRNIKHV